MNFLSLLEHPITQALWDGAKYTAPKVMAAVRENMLAKPVTEEDIQQAAASTAEPDFGETLESTEVSP
jgi:hypothetical protein